MIKEIIENITLISSDNDDLNTENYIDSLMFLDNIYKIVVTMQKYVQLNNLEFLPSFTSRNISERFGIICSAEENEMRYFKIKSDLFLGQPKLVDDIKHGFSEICSKIEFEKNILTLTIK